jgi:hypothetical protein
MKCAICGVIVDSIDEAVDQGWIPYFYDGAEEHETACPSCTEALLRNGDDGEMEVKDEYRGKLRYLDEIGDETWQDHSEVVMAVLENEPGKLN